MMLTYFRTRRRRQCRSSTVENSRSCRDQNFEQRGKFPCMVCFPRLAFNLKKWRIGTGSLADGTGK